MGLMTEEEYLRLECNAQDDNEIDVVVDYDDESGCRQPRHKPEATLELVSAVDDTKPIIDLRKELPEPLAVPHPICESNFVLRCFNSRDPVHASDMFDILHDNCTGFDLRDGKLYMTFSIDSLTAKTIIFKKSMVRSVDITYYSYILDEERRGEELFKLSYHVEFSHIEMTGRKRHVPGMTCWNTQSLTVVYKLRESIR